MVQTGVPDGSKRFRELTDEKWQHIIRLNLATTVNATRAVLPAMPGRGYGAASTSGGTSHPTPVNVTPS